MPDMQAVSHFQFDPLLERSWLAKGRGGEWEEMMMGVTWRVPVSIARNGRLEYSGIGIGVVRKMMRVVLEAHCWPIEERHRAGRQWAVLDR
jgi:hypothetical protein